MPTRPTKLEHWLLGFVTLLAVSLTTALSCAQDKTIVIAHRGACGYLPEHTLEAASMAHAMRADFIEQDVVLTKDGVPVVLHDIHLDTVTDVARKFPDRAREDTRFYAIDFSLAEIKRLSVHERISLKTGEAIFPNRFDASKSLFRVPTLAEEIELIQGLNATTKRDVGIYVEIKKPAWHREQSKDISKMVLNALTQHGYKTKADNVYLQCFDPKETRRIREELKSGLKLVQLIGDNGWNEADTDFDQLRTESGIKTIAQYADGIGPWMPHILEPVNGAAPKKTDLISRAHKHGLVVHPFTFRKDSLPEYASSFDELLQRFFEQDIDGLFTDFPDLTVRFRNEFELKKN
jgi:glycerophosphoryl diester phosphodiesterase